MSDNPPVYPEGPFGACYDCGRRYGGEYGFPDLVVPHDVWNNVLSPRKDEGGLLCPSCMCRRAHAAGIKCEAVFRSGPFSAPPPLLQVDDKGRVSVVGEAEKIAALEARAAAAEARVARVKASVQFMRNCIRTARDDYEKGVVDAYTIVLRELDAPDAEAGKEKL